MFTYKLLIFETEIQSGKMSQGIQLAALLREIEGAKQVLQKLEQQTEELKRI